jgi:hypothetical protein
MVLVVLTPSLSGRPPLHGPKPWRSTGLLRPQLLAMRSPLLLLLQLLLPLRRRHRCRCRWHRHRCLQPRVPPPRRVWRADGPRVRGSGRQGLSPTRRHRRCYRCCRCYRRRGCSTHAHCWWGAMGDSSPPPRLLHARTLLVGCDGRRLRVPVHLWPAWRSRGSRGGCARAMCGREQVGGGQPRESGTHACHAVPCMRAAQHAGGVPEGPHLNFFPPTHTHGCIPTRMAAACPPMRRSTNQLHSVTD